MGQALVLICSVILTLLLPRPGQVETGGQT